MPRYKVGGDTSDHSITVTELADQLNLSGADNAGDVVFQKLSTAFAHVESLCGGMVPMPIPAPVREAVLMLAAWLYEQREAALPGTTGVGVVTVPFGFDELIAPYRAWEF